MLKIYPENKDVEKIDFCKRFSSAAEGPKYVLGINEYSTSIAENINLDGFVDDYTDQNEFCGKPIIKTEELPKRSLVVSTVTIARPLTAMKKLEKQGVDNLDYFNFEKYSNLNLKKISSLYQFKLDIKNNLDKYKWIYKKLYDEKSKEIFNNLINFKIHNDLSYMEEFKFAPKEQYFESFLNLKDKEVFVDAGGFKGETTIEFINRCPNYKSVYFFEPDPHNFKIAEKNLESYDSIHFHLLGLAEESKTLKMESGVGSASKVSKNGNLLIKVNSLDNVINDKITFIKMDIEGSEGIALEGAKNHIKEDHPKLAISCYHKSDDFWRIPQKILDIRDDYSIYLRHYTEGITETVMFFIPNK